MSSYCRTLGSLVIVNHSIILDLWSLWIIPSFWISGHCESFLLDLWSLWIIPLGSLVIVNHSIILDLWSLWIIPLGSLVIVNHSSWISGHCEPFLLDLWSLWIIPLGSLVIVNHSIILHSPGLQFLACIYNTIYNITLLLSVNTPIAWGMFCGAKYTHHTFTPIIKHLMTTTANKHPGKKWFTDKNMRRRYTVLGLFKNTNKKTMFKQVH